MCGAIQKTLTIGRKVELKVGHIRMFYHISKKWKIGDLEGMGGIAPGVVIMDHYMLLVDRERTH